MHLYIHVPFCARRCSYCDFSIAVRRHTPSLEFATAIRAEWEVKQPGWPDAGLLKTLYFGGGTPSRLDSAVLIELIGFFGSTIGFNADAEVTLEVNPDDVTADQARAWAIAGVTRISLGVQSHDPSVLAWMHRTHTADQVPIAIAILREAGFDNISTDLIFGLPAARGRDWNRDLELTLALQPEHLSLYGLTIEPQTPLARWADRGEAIPVTDDRYAEEYLTAHQALTRQGLEHYEVSNAGRPGRHSRHNSAYWSGADYLGLGPSAHSLQDGVRSWNMPAWASYEVAVGQGKNPMAGSETLDQAARRLEERYLGLRTTNGVRQEVIPDDTREEWVRAGWATADGARCRLTVDGWLRLDALVASLRDS